MHTPPNTSSYPCYLYGGNRPWSYYVYHLQPLFYTCTLQRLPPTQLLCLPSSPPSTHTLWKRPSLEILPVLPLPLFHSHPHLDGNHTKNPNLCPLPPNSSSHSHCICMHTKHRLYLPTLQEISSQLSYRPAECGSVRERRKDLDLVTLVSLSRQPALRTMTRVSRHWNRGYGENKIPEDVVWLPVRWDTKQSHANRISTWCPPLS